MRSKDRGKDQDGGSVPGESRGGVYFEFTAIGSSVKVAAIHADSGIEVVVIGPATAARADLQRLALQKLKARLTRRQD